MADRPFLPRDMQPIDTCLRHAITVLGEIDALGEDQLGERWRRLRCVRQWLAAGVVGIEQMLVEVEQQLATTETLNDPLTSSGEMKTIADACCETEVES